MTDKDKEVFILKLHIKKLLPAFLMALVSSFMLFIYEPLTMFATNVDDFWFDIYIMIKPNLLFFGLFTLVLFASFSGVYLINNHFSEKLHFYKGTVLLAFIALIVMYIHGNFFIGNLPKMDGTQIDWNVYTKENIISCVIIAVAGLIGIITTYKFKYDKVIKVYCFVSFAIVFMLSTSLVGTLSKENVWNRKELVSVSTANNINCASENKNFFILLVDAVDSTKFKEVLDKSQYNGMMNDFSYYPDTMSVYRFTRDTIPYLFSDGTLNKNEKDFDTYYNDSFNNSTLIKELESRDYSIGIYDYEFKWNSRDASKIKNVKTIANSVNKKQYLREIAKYDLFKYLPYPLKRFSHIEKMDYNNCKIVSDAEIFSWDDKNFYNNVKNNDIEKINEKNFSFIHLEGAHAPFNYDSDLNVIGESGGTYDDKVSATITVINEYLERLKKAGVYDNSAIIVMADHGYDYESGHGRQNPILYIKGVNEHHDSMITSDKPVSFTDLNEIYTDLLNGKKSEELLPNVDYNRKRIFLWYEYLNENHMVEYEQNGHAWDETTLVPTGKEYNR